MIFSDGRLYCNYDLNYATGQKGVFKPGDIVGIVLIRSYYTNDIVGKI